MPPHDGKEVQVPKLDPVPGVAKHENDAPAARVPAQVAPVTVPVPVPEVVAVRVNVVVRLKVAVMVQFAPGMVPE